MASRLYINYFQPSFKLKSKKRDGARVEKLYYPPSTPCERLMASTSIDDATKERLKDECNTLDPMTLLRDIRAAQQGLQEPQRALQNRTPMGSSKPHTSG